MVQNWGILQASSCLMENVGTSRLLVRSIIGVDLHESLDKGQLDPAIPV